MRGCLILLGDGATDFAEFFHQIVAGVDAAGGVANEELGLVRDGFLMGVETDGGGIGVGISRDDRDVEALAPALELLDGGGAEGVGGGHDDGAVALFQPQAELGGRGGFSGAVDADDEDDEGFTIGPRGGREEIVRQALGELAAGDCHDVVARDLAAEGAELVDDGGSEANAEVGGDEISLEVVPIDFGAVGDFIEEGFEKASHAAGD